MSVITKTLQAPVISRSDLLDCLFEAAVCTDADGKITHWNLKAEALTCYHAKDMIGRSCREDILLHISEAADKIESGWHPMADTMADGKPREACSYLRHKDGHLILVTLRTSPLWDEAGNLVGAIEFLQEVPQCEQGAACFSDTAFIDSDTQLANRKYLELRLQSRFDEMKRYNWTFGVLMVSLDNYDPLRQQHGAEVAGRILKAVGKSFASCLRSFDVVGKWEDQKFMAIVPILNYSDLYVIGERIRKIVAKTYVTVENGTVAPTVSVGAAGAHKEDSIERLVQRTGLWLTRSRKEGGNKVTY